jgi:STE24 endopeptidase
MHCLLVILILGLFIHDAAPRQVPQDISISLLLAAAIVAKLLIAVLYGMAARTARKRLRSEQPGLALRRIDRRTGLFRMAVLGLYSFDLAVGLLSVLRNDLIGDHLLLDELLFLLPTLGLFVFAWWAYYPIDRVLREAAIIRSIHRGQPLYPIEPRGKYILNHLRHEVLLILVPLLLIFAWHETITTYADQLWRPGGQDITPLLTMAGAATVFLFSPMIIRYLWDTQPLPAGDIRSRMLAMCRQHRVGVRQILLWRTAGGMINAAVMGLIAPLRFILLTDALLDQLPEKQLEAVMAHELAHVRKHHMFWLLAVAVVVLGSSEIAFHLLFTWAMPLVGLDSALTDSQFAIAGTLSNYEQLLMLVGSICAISVWGVTFGWVSRRTERQADAFAVAHLAAVKQTDETQTTNRNDSPLCADAQSVQTMVAALQQVADLNHVPVNKHNWRHGSIAWRQTYLQSLINQPINNLPIDRTMRNIKLATLTLIALLALALTSL